MPDNTDLCNRTEIISRSPWFEALPSSVQEKLASHSNIRDYEKNSYVFMTGEKTTDIYCVLSGRIRIAISSALGQEFAMTEMESESWFGEAALAGDDQRVAGAQAQEKTTLLVIPRSIVFEVADSHPELYKTLFLDHVHRTRRMYELLGGMLFYPLHSRLAGRLLELIKNHGEHTDDGVYLNIKLSQSDFAQLSFGSRQRINKIFREWIVQGILEMKSDRYLIRDIDALKKEIDLSVL